MYLRAVTLEFQFYTWRSAGLKNQRAHVVQWTTPSKLFTFDVPLRGAAPRRDAQECDLGEAQNAEEEPSRRRTRVNEAGDAGPGSPDSITRGVENLQLADVPAAQPVTAVRAPPTVPNSQRPTQQRPRHQRAFLQCAQCGADPLAYIGHADCGLTGHVSQKHGGQPLAQESVTQLRQLDRARVPSNRAEDTVAITAEQTPQLETWSWGKIHKDR